jgi:K+-sensing histidine kinase KdpD
MPMRMREELVGVLGVDYGEHLHDQASPDERMLIGAIARLGALVLERDRLLRRWAESRASELALRATNEQMDTFLTIASHELKSPIAVIKLSLQGAERRLHALARRQAAQGQVQARTMPMNASRSSLPARCSRWRGWSGWSMICWMSRWSRQASWNCSRKALI